MYKSGYRFIPSPVSNLYRFPYAFRIEASEIFQLPIYSFSNPIMVTVETSYDSKVYVKLDNGLEGYLG